MLPLAQVVGLRTNTHAYGFTAPIWSSPRNGSISFVFLRRLFNKGVKHPGIYHRFVSAKLQWGALPRPPSLFPASLSLSLSVSPVHNLCACVYILVHFCVCVSLCGLLSDRGSVGYIARVCIWVPCQLLISKPTPSTWLSNLGYLVSALLVGACALVRVLCCCMKAYRPGIVWVLFT